MFWLFSYFVHLFYINLLTLVVSVPLLPLKSLRRYGTRFAKKEKLKWCLILINVNKHKPLNCLLNWYCYFCWVRLYTPKVPKIPSLQYLSNTSKKRWEINMVFYMRLNKVLYKLISSYLVAIARHAQNNKFAKLMREMKMIFCIKFAISSQYLKKEMSDEVELLPVRVFCKLVLSFFMDFARHDRCLQKEVMNILIFGVHRPSHWNNLLHMSTKDYYKMINFIWKIKVETGVSIMFSCYRCFFNIGKFSFDKLRSWVWCRPLIRDVMFGKN